MEEKSQRQECLGPMNQALSLQMPSLQDPGLKLFTAQPLSNPREPTLNLDVCVDSDKPPRPGRSSSSVKWNS